MAMGGGGPWHPARGRCGSGGPRAEVDRPSGAPAAFRGHRPNVRTARVRLLENHRSVDLGGTGGRWSGHGIPRAPKWPTPSIGEWLGDSYVDRGLIPGLEYRYAIQAVGEAGSSSRSEPVAAKPPIPAVGEARLDGVFKVVATVRSAGLLKTLIGIDDPGAGDQTVLIWPIKATCPAAQGACGAKWRRKDPPLDRNGGTHSGKVVTREARCGGSEDRFPATNYLSLRVTKAEIQGFILVATAFEGTLEVTFRCEGRRVRGVVRVAGRAT